MKFGHVAIRVKDIDTMLDFYCNKLGLKEAFRIYNDDKSLRIVYVHITDNQYLEFCVGGQKRSDFDDLDSLGVRHTCFTCDNIKEVKKDLEQKGAKFETDIMILKDGNMTAYLFDPEGNKLELTQITEGSPQSQFAKKLLTSNG